MTLSPHCIFVRGISPIIATAIHNGHDTRPDVDRQLALGDKQRLREEDPFTGGWTQFTGTQIVGLRSRFEVDLNRPRDKAVYQQPEDAWGMDVWNGAPDNELIEESLREYDQFYASIRELLNQRLELYERVVVYDLHTYNQYRDGPEGIAADRAMNPEVNVGTGTMDRDYWAAVVDRFVTDLRQHDYHGRHLDVRENVKFRGGHFGKWIHETWPKQVCTMSIEFRKFFMDEWEGIPDLHEVECIYEALRSTVRGVQAALENM